MPQRRLLVCGRIEALGEVCRGMPVLARDGEVVGVVAAVVQSGPSQTITHILLGQAPPTTVYRLIPAAMLDHLKGEYLSLHAAPAQVAALPTHQPDC